MLNRLEREITIMVKKVDGVYGTRNTNLINQFLQGEYKEFRTYWLNKVDENTFGSIWNKVNHALQKEGK